MFYEFKHPLSVDYFKVEKGTDFSFPAHIHHCFEIIAVTDGEMTVCADKNEYLLRAGEAVLLFPNQIHSLDTKGKSSHVLCLFSPNLVSAFTSAVKSRHPVSNLFYPEDYLVKKLSVIGEDCGSIEKKGLLYSLLADFDKNAEYRDSAPERELLLYSIFGFIEENFGKDCSLSALSKNVGYEYTYLSHYFRRIVGMSYNDYVNEYRISRACYLLTNKNDTVLDISCECGFNSLRSFNRNFRERLGTSPAEYRKSTHGNK